MTTEMTTRDESTLARIDLDERTGANAVSSLVMRGDLSGLGPEDRARYYVAVCEGLGLNPHSQPFAFLRLNGKEVLYATRGCTDQLARIHRVTRTIVDGPKLVDLGGTKLVLCVAQASHPNGRVETSTATVPFVDPVNVLMKAETKAKRRVTLSLLGLGMLDEMELETIPASAQEPGGGVDLSRAAPRASVPSLASIGVEVPAARQVVAVAPVEPPAEEPSQTLVSFRGSLARVDSPASAVTLWLAARHELVGDEKNLAWGEIAHRVRAVWPSDHECPKSTGGWLKNECAKADAAPSPTPPEEPPPPTGKRTRKSAPAADATSSPASSEDSGDGARALAAVPVWMSSADAMRDHLASKTHARAVEASVRQHGRHSRAYVELAAQRLEALTPPDADGARIAASSCSLTVERWAHEGPRTAVAQKAKVA
jgi:hypothetical protein